MDKSKSAPTGHKFILPKLIATPKAEPGNARPPHFLLQKKPVLIRYITKAVPKSLSIISAFRYV
jgi:hypothetical protein